MNSKRGLCNQVAQKGLTKVSLAKPAVKVLVCKNVVPSLPATLLISGKKIDSPDINFDFNAIHLFWKYIIVRAMSSVFFILYIVYFKEQNLSLNFGRGYI